MLWCFIDMYMWKTAIVTALGQSNQHYQRETSIYSNGYDRCICWTIPYKSWNDIIIRDLHYACNAQNLWLFIMHMMIIKTKETNFYHQFYMHNHEFGAYTDNIFSIKHLVSTCFPIVLCSIHMWGGDAMTLGKDSGINTVFDKTLTVSLWVQGLIKSYSV